MFSAQSSGAVSFSCLVANTFLEFEGDRSPSELVWAGSHSLFTNQIIFKLSYLPLLKTELVHPSPTFFLPSFLQPHTSISSLLTHYSYSISMGIILFICVLFTLMVPSFSLPFSIRSSIESGNRLSASVSTGIVIAICMSYLPCQAHWGLALNILPSRDLPHPPFLVFL